LKKSLGEEIVTHSRKKERERKRGKEKEECHKGAALLKAAEGLRSVTTGSNMAGRRLV
jgi:hypothetical protein